MRMDICLALGYRQVCGADNVRRTYPPESRYAGHSLLRQSRRNDGALCDFTEMVSSVPAVRQMGLHSVRSMHECLGVFAIRWICLYGNAGANFAHILSLHRRRHTIRLRLSFRG